MKGKTAMEDGRFAWKQTLMDASIIAALIGLIGIVATSWIQNKKNMELQQDRFQQELILRVTDRNTVDEQVKYLRFITELGLIPNYLNRIQPFIENPDRLPRLKELSANIKAKSSTGSVNLELRRDKP